MMNSFSNLEYDEVFGKDDQSFSILEYSSHQGELTNNFSELKDEILSSGNYDYYLPSSSSFVSLPDLEPISIVSYEDILNECGSVSWTEEESLTDEHKTEDFGLVKTTETEPTKKRRGREDYESNCSVAKTLSKETISQYYNMPIAQAAKKLNIGLTPLKKICRELDIKRWPHRKFMSLQNLIKNLEEELEKEKEKGGEKADKLRNDLEKLEREMKTIVEFPNLEFEDKTKKLRQACFKANHMRKRRLVMST